MNFLFETYELLYPMIQVRNSQVRNLKDRFRNLQIRTWVMKMFAMAVVTALCVAGVAFCVRFMVALCKEREPRLVGYWLRPRLGSTDTIAELQQCKNPVTRAA